MRRIKSIRTQLAVYLVLGFVLLEFLAGIGLFAYVEEALEHTLDTALAAKAEQIASTLHIEDDGQPHLLNINALVLQSPHRDGAFFFQIWRADGTVLARVGPPGDDQPLPKLMNTRRQFGDVTFRNGSFNRAIQLSVVPLPDEDEFDPAAQKPRPPSREVMTLLVAHDRHAIDEALTVLLTGLSFTALLVTVGIIAIVTWSVRQGLRPLVAVGRQVDRISSSSLEVRFPLELLPSEILPIGQKLNDLMDRLQSAFVRERRFSADVAHELRTPIAELKSLCEVSLRWPDDNRAPEAVAESLTIARQMESTVNALLSLVRCQAGVEVAEMGPVDLTALITSIWKSIKADAVSKQLTVAQTFPAQSQIESDRNMLAIVLRNLLSNAVQHTPIEGNIEMELVREPGKLVLSIVNTNATLESDDLPHLFEPFWQKDAARSSQGHEGLGLAIVQEYCRVLGISIEAGFDKSKQFQMRLSLPDTYFRSKIANPANRKSLSI